METTQARTELARFLRARRTLLAPPEVGLATGPRRRTPGLRREEIAAIANVGVTWYTWLEQGRANRVSTDVLGRIAAALRLSRSDRAYLYKLAGAEHPATDDGNAPDDRLQLAVDTVTGGPAVVVDPRFDVVAYNRLADRIYALASVRGRFACNHLWRAFMDPARARLYGNAVEELRHWFVGRFRANYVAHLGEPAFEELLDALRTGSEAFDREWRAHRTADVPPAVPLALRTRRWGTVRIDSVRFLLPDRPGYLMFVGPPADRATKRVFARMQK